MPNPVAAEGAEWVEAEVVSEGGCEEGEERIEEEEEDQSPFEEGVR